MTEKPAGSRVIKHFKNSGQVLLGPCVMCGINWKTNTKRAHQGRYPVRCPKHNQMYSTIKYGHSARKSKKEKK